MSLECDEGVAVALPDTRTHNATHNNAIGTRWPNECMNLCVTVLVNGRGMIGGLVLGNSSLRGSAQLAILCQLGDGRED